MEVNEYLKSIKFSLDKIHWIIDRVLSYNKKFMYVISAREAGKSTGLWTYAFNNLVRRNKTTIVLRRQIADITSTYIDDIANVLNKFSNKPIELYYSKGSLGSGIVEVSIGEPNKPREAIPFFRVIALSNPIARVKSLMFPDLGLVLFDEFICNTRMGEKYLRDEVFKFKEIYNTFQREAESGLKVIFAGNPYSLFNPYFVWQEFDTKQIYPGSFIVTENAVLECYQLSDELKEFILARNPLYKFDDSYSKYAFDGRAINDEQILIMDKQPNSFKLKYVFYVNHTYLGIFNGLTTGDDGDYIVYWCSKINKPNRDVYCFDINDLIKGNVLLSTDTKKMFYLLKASIQRRRVAYKSIEENYLIEEVYQCI